MNKNEKTGCNSVDPGNDKHNWPEYTQNEGGDEVILCRCGVSFFGFSYRKKCWVCHLISKRDT